jgi:hypothetical protein
VTLSLAVHRQPDRFGIDPFYNDFVAGMGIDSETSVVLPCCAWWKAPPKSSTIIGVGRAMGVSTAS